MKILSCVAFFFLFGICSEKVNGQAMNVFDDLESSKSGEGKIRIIQDKSIEAAFEKFQLEQNKHRGIEGYRIRIFSDSGPNAKSRFEEAKARFIGIFEDVRLHESFVYPNYKLYVGDFKTKSEALKVLKAIEGIFPDAFIVQTKINFPNFKSE
jgi:hypothetical protein